MIYTPDRLYYNCDNPLAVLTEKSIRLSEVHTGVSMSEAFDMGSHGPFKITFRRSPWFDQMVQVQYWRTHFTGIRPTGTARSVSGEVLIQPDYLMRQAKYFDDHAVPHAFTNRVWKETLMFATEREWYTWRSVQLSEGDVEKVTFMTNAPVVIGKVTLNRRIKTLKQLYPGLYEEKAVDDDYLKGKVDPSHF